MPIPFRCSHCQYSFNAQDHLAGKRIRCPECRGVTRVPEASAVPEVEEVEEAATRQPVDEVTAPDTEETRQPGERRKRRRRRRRPRPQSNNLLETFHYYTAAFGIFPWILLGLCMMWCCTGILSLLVPGLPLAVVIMGALMYNVGWIWLLVVAFRDDTFHGMICLLTHLYWIAYTFVNLEEAWKPAVLMVLGIVVALSGWVLLGIQTAHLGDTASLSPALLLGLGATMPFPHPGEYGRR